MNIKIALTSFLLFSNNTFAASLSTLIGSGGGGSTVRSGSATFTRDSSWVVPAGLTSINVQILGAGGGGPSYGGAGSGGGGGGSCIKNAAVVLSSANGGRGANGVETQGQPGEVTNTVLTVTAGSTLTIFVGGGGGAAALNSTSTYSAGGGGYGACGTGGAGGLVGANAGGTSAANYGGGGGATNTAAGGNASSTTGGTGAGSGGLGGTATNGGTAGSGTAGGGGGASGGIGGVGSYNATYSFISGKGNFASNVTSYSSGNASYPCSGSVKLDAGAPGTLIFCNGYALFSTGGAGGAVIISW